jgi:putative ABC transport system permease protein
MRTLLSVLLIGVPVMLILTLVGVSQGFMEDSRQRTRGVGADIIVMPGGASFTTGAAASLPEKMVGRLKELPHVAETLGVDRSLSGNLWESVSGIDYGAFKRLNGGFTFVEGDEEHAFSRPRDIVVTTLYAAQQRPNLHVGSRTKLLNQWWNVSAVVEPGKLGQFFVRIGELQELTEAQGKVSQIYVKVDDPRNIDIVVDELHELLSGYTVFTIKKWIEMTNVDQIPALAIFVNVIIGIGVITGLVVVSLSMYMAVLQRTREIGILKSMGATKVFVMNLILWEAAAMGLGGTVVGIALSFASRAALKHFVAASLPQAIVPSWWPIVCGIALGSALLGAIYPGMIAVRHDPIEALSYE